MVDDLAEKLMKGRNAAAFAELFVKRYLSPAFGALSKTEIDVLVFTGLIEAKVIDPEGSIYDIARSLNITPTKARGLLMNWQLRSAGYRGDLREAIVSALKNTRFSKDGTLLTFGVESPLLKEEIVARLKRKGVFSDASFSKELVRLPVDAFVEFLDEILDEKTKNEVRTALVKDKQLPDRSFKALAAGVLSKLGEKVAGKAGEAFLGETVGEAVKPVAKKLTSFLSGLFSGNADRAVSGITKDDYLDV